jgi:hypothetical protein
VTEIDLIIDFEKLTDIYLKIEIENLKEINLIIAL